MPAHGAASRGYAFTIIFDLHANMAVRTADVDPRVRLFRMAMNISEAFLHDFNPVCGMSEGPSKVDAIPEALQIRRLKRAVVITVTQPQKS